MKLVLLDRDGVINFDSEHYIKSPAEWKAIPGSLEAIAKLNQAGMKVAVVTNQSGIGRGLYDLETLAAIHHKMETELNAHGGHFDGIYFCPHHPDDQCDCRKPKPGMAIQAMHDFGISPEETIFIGDSYRDLQAAIAARCTPTLVLTGNGLKTQTTKDVSHITTYQNLAECVAHGI